MAVLWERYFCLSVALQYKVFDTILSKIIMLVSTDVILVSEKTDKALFDMTPLGLLFLCVPLINNKISREPSN
jgi:predicted transcriptional regulator